MYYIIGADQKEYGPVSFEEVRRWIAEGRANGRTRIRTEGATEWRPLEEWAAFAPDLHPGPRQTPPVFSAAAPVVYERVGGTNNLAVAGLVCGLLGIFCCLCGPLFSLVGLILSIVALGQVNASPNQSGRGLAIAGIVVSGFGLLISMGWLSARLFHLGRPFRVWHF